MCNFERILKYGIMDDPKEKRSRELQRDQLFENELDDLLERLGITFSEEFNLILHNDNINDMLHVVLSLSDVCRLSYEKATLIMKAAHNSGHSKILASDNITELHFMRLGLKRRGLTATLELAQ